MENITRREAIKKSALLLGGTLLLPDILKAWTSPIIENNCIPLGDLSTQLIAEISELIIPTTDTPGAKEAGVPAFIQKILSDCFSTKDRNAVLKGVLIFEKTVLFETQKSFLGLEKEEQISFLKSVEKEYFLKTLKTLTITGYFTSEIGVTQALRYEQIPIRYDADVFYKKGDKAWF
jgi:hypothetical protein